MSLLSKKMVKFSFHQKNFFCVIKHYHSPTNHNTYQSWRGTLKRDFWLFWTVWFISGHNLLLSFPISSCFTFQSQLLLLKLSGFENVLFSAWLRVHCEKWRRLVAPQKLNNSLQCLNSRGHFLKVFTSFSEIGFGRQLCLVYSTWWK